MSAAQHFTIASRLQAMLDVEAALADAEASLDIIPRSAAVAIRDACRATLYDADGLQADAARAGNLAIPLVRAVTARVASVNPVAARYVHWGATSQDIIDTALVLQLRQALPRIIDDLRHASDAAARHAREHATDVMAGRTWLQQATPVTFGLKAAGWVDALDRVACDVRNAMTSASVLQLGGASGTLAALGDRGPAVAKQMSDALGLHLPPIPWHAHRDRLASLSCALGIATGVLGKIARDVALLAQSEVGEVHEGSSEGVSSSMPQKRNPVNCAIALASAVRAPGLVATMLAALPQEHERALGGWQAEWETLPELVVVAAGAASAIADALDNLVVHPERMRANLDASGGLLLAEAVAMRLAPTLGKQEAHSLVERAARQASAEGRTFADVLAGDAQIAAVLDRRQIDETLSPDRYLGSASAFIADVLARHSKG